MTFSKIRTGMYVFDRWWPKTCSGIVIKKTKTLLHVEWKNGEKVRYDILHCQFLGRRKCK